jgi:hypothetical protein
MAWVTELPRISHSEQMTVNRKLLRSRSLVRGGVILPNATKWPTSSNPVWGP